MVKYIRIQAKCDAFEIDEEKSEGKTDRRLKQILTMYRSIRDKHGEYKAGKLKVTTHVVNPTLL